MSPHTYFFYDPHEGMRFFATEVAALAAAQQTIERSRREVCAGSSWAADDLAMLAVGRVTHVVQRWSDGGDSSYESIMLPLADEEEKVHDAV